MPVVVPVLAVVVPVVGPVVRAVVMAVVRAGMVADPRTRGVGRRGRGNRRRGKQRGGEDEGQTGQRAEPQHETPKNEEQDPFTFGTPARWLSGSPAFPSREMLRRSDLSRRAGRSPARRARPPS
ncbi:MAG: hypothetical protein ACTHJH_08495 [Marmoricola sp.]